MYIAQSHQCSFGRKTPNHFHPSFLPGSSTRSACSRKRALVFLSGRFFAIHGAPRDRSKVRGLVDNDEYLIVIDKSDVEVLWYGR
jgi:hypothetical protein